ncbi:S8 family serine peptidase [Streptomyces sp. NPDC059477]|uniref:S8 family serine peptidase n=1 Tax=Streptomyces sp. NPDC059477 TaxID=3346847 RepID=UPI0036A0701C
MTSGTSRRAERTVFLRTRGTGRVRTVSALVGALAAVGVGLAPGATAVDTENPWYLETMQAEQMWQTSTGEGVKVAVIDTGVNPETSSLKGQVLTDEVPESVAYGATDDYSGHGTTMAELIAGTGEGGGIQGLAPGAKILPIRVALEGLEVGPEFEKAPETWDALRAAADTDARIISMSFGGMTSDEDDAAVRYAASKGKLLVSALGNDGFTDSPADTPYVIGAAAVDSSIKVIEGSPEGKYADLAAPGADIPGWCDATFQSYCAKNGSSSATALTSASAALIWSAHPDWTVNQVTRALVDTAGRDWPKEKPSSYLGYGFVRPRLVLAEPDYDGGPANVDPLAKENGGDLLAKSAEPAGASPSPSGSSSSPSGSSPAPQEGSSGGTSAAGSNASESGDSNTLWITVGAAAAVIVVGGAGFAVLRARRTR